MLTDPRPAAGQPGDMFLDWAGQPASTASLAPSGGASRYDRPMARRGSRRRGTPKRPPRSADDLDAGQFDEPDWVWVGDQRVFVVGYTPAGVPFGCFEDELDDLR